MPYGFRRFHANEMASLSSYCALHASVAPCSMTRRRYHRQRDRRGSRILQGRVSSPSGTEGRPEMGSREGVLVLPYRAGSHVVSHNAEAT